MKLKAKYSHIIIVLYLAIFGQKSNAQNERNIWYFGDQAGIDFTNSLPESIDNNNIERNIVFGVIEGPNNIICASDDEGNLLFYSDGRVFRNKLHQNMLNSPTIAYLDFYSQAAVIRDPGNPNRYYVFVTIQDIQDSFRSKLTYTIVDMSLNNGLGGLVPDQTHVVMTTQKGQHMTTAQHANGRDTWLITIRNGIFFSYLITENGIVNSPVTSTVDISPFSDNDSLSVGMMETSPNNKLIAVGFPILQKISLFGFDNLTGRLDLIFEDKNLDQFIPEFPQIAPISPEFSKDSKVLYVAFTDGGIQQYDISNLNFIPEEIQISGGSYPYIKRGPDGKIFTIQNGQASIGAINLPTNLGLACNFNSSVLSLSRPNLVDLPTFLSPKFPEGISFINICEGETTQINFTGTFREVTRIEWDLGDGNIASGDTVNYIYSDSGTYTVTANIIDEETDEIIFTATESITIYDSPTLSTPDDLYFCSEDTTISFFSLNDVILDGQDPTQYNIRYYLTEQDALTGGTEILDFTPEVGTTTIWIKVENKISTTCYDIVSFRIIVPEFITIDIPTQQYICDLREGLTLEAPDGFISYTWSNGANTQTTTVYNTGQYTLYVEKDFGNFICEAQVTILVLEGDELPIIEEIKVIDWSQNHNSIEVILDRRGNYEFSVDGINYQESPIFLNLPINNYYVYIRDAGCLEEIKSDKLFLLYYNKFFTPNGDGVNDYWQVINANREENIDIVIYDRYGKLLSKLKYYDLGWDGTFNGTPMPTSDYWFTVIRENGDMHYGHFTLKR